MQQSPRPSDSRFFSRLDRLARHQRQLVLLRAFVAPSAMMAQTLDFLAKRLHTLKASIDRSKPYVRDLIQVLQLLHDQLANGACRNLALTQHPQLVTNACAGLLDRLDAYRTFLQRLGHAGFELALIERLAIT